MALLFSYTLETYEVAPGGGDLDLCDDVPTETCTLDLTSDVPAEITLDLAADSGKVYTGAGVQQRTFVSTSGKTTDEKIEFDITLELESGSGAQDMDTEVVCTYEDIVEFGAGGGDPVTLAEGCTPRRFDDWIMSWDGADRIDVSDPNGCNGFIERR